MLQNYIPYATVAALSAVALIRFAHNIRKYTRGTQANFYFVIAVYSMAVCAAMEFLFTFHESGLITHPLFCYATEVLYSLFSLVSAYFWCMSSEIEQNSWLVRTKRRRVVATLPFAVMAVVVLSTPMTHMVFYFTKSGHYTRGPLNNVLVYLSAICVAKSGISALIRSTRPQYYLKRHIYRTFFYYALGLVVAQVFQIALGAILPFRIVGAVVVFYLVQERTFKQNIFTDILSDANNRNAIDYYLKTHFIGADDRFAFIMIDMDAFKEINDTYGHSMGDKTISLIASAFKRTLPPEFFFGRYGGDEFIVIGNVESPDDIGRIMTDARENIRRLAKENGFVFCPDFSYGAALKTADVTSIPDLINRADAAMYENKKARKAGL